MNVTPEVLERLKQLANLVSKKGNSQKNVNDNKKEPDQKGNEDDKENDTSGSGKTSVTNGRVSPDLNGTNEDAPTPDNKQVKGDGVFSQMDTDAFRQVLKDVITKRTLAIEKRVLADVEALKTQVCELEAQKIQLQCDSERLKQTLKEISTKQEKQKVQMVSCGTQVDMELIEERPLSPEISKPVRPKFVPERSILLNQMRSAKNILENQGETVYNEKVVAESRDKLKVFLQTTEKNAKHSGTTESMTVCSNSGMSTAQNVPATAQNVTNVLLDKDVSVGVLIQPPSQGQKITTESVVTRDPHDKLHLRNIHSSDNTQTPLNFRPLSVVRVEAHYVGQEQQNNHQQSPRLDMPQQKRGPPGVNTSVPSGYPCIQNYQGHFSQRSSESFLPNRQQFSSCRWLGPPPNQANQNGHVHRQPHPSVYNRPTDLTNHRSNATPPGGPHNVTFFDQPKRRRVENMCSSNVQRTNIVSSNENYVMEHFKVQRTPVVPGATRSQKYMQTYGPATTNQAPYISRPLNHPPGTHFNQGIPNSRPPPNVSLHAMNKAPNRPPAALSQGQLVEKVLYPTAGSQPGGNAYQDYQRVMLPGPHPRTENVQASNKSSQSNNTVYVVQEYQVLSQYNVSRSRTTPLQSIAPAPAAVPRNPTCPPVQSPGISSTASPSACHPGGPNAGQVSHAVSHPSNANAVRTSITQTLLKTPPKPTASIVVVQDGIVLSWNMKLDDSTAKIDNYELFACQDGAESTNPPIMWKKIGIVKALPLPMACTLTQFSSGNKYHFAVRAVDDQERAGPFSDPCTIALTK